MKKNIAVNNIQNISGIDQSNIPVGLAALASDVCIHSHLYAGSAAVESAIIGVPTLMIDREGHTNNILYQLDKGKVIFDNWPNLIENLISELILDSQNPYLEWLYPNGGEQFDNFETVTVGWASEDDSFGDEAISIYLSTELGGYYNSVAEGVPNAGGCQGICRVLPTLGHICGQRGGGVR